MSHDRAKAPPTGKKKPKGDYPVGYARPPSATKFQKGHKGQGGRPKRANTPSSIETAFDREIWITDSGKRRKVSVEEALGLGILQRALAGEPQAVNTALKLLHMLQKSRPPPLTKEEREQRQALEPGFQRIMHLVREMHRFRQTLWLLDIGHVHEDKFYLREWVQEAAHARRTIPGVPPRITPEPPELKKRLDKEK